VLVEHARTLCGIADAAHAESDFGGTPVVTLLACSLADTAIDVAFVEGTRLRGMHGGAPLAHERTTCNYGLDPALAWIAAAHGMVVAATDATGEVRAVERADHPCFVATLYQPQLSSAPGVPHPLWTAFVRSVLARDGGG
jgi:CTP synthase (UTP-ammonia lyase)